MIDSIRIAGVATYGSPPEILTGLARFNFVFGTNGVGKTTITRVIADEVNYPTCNIAWKGGTKLQAVVYNRDFVEKNFNQPAELKGIFTLGEKNVEAFNKIVKAKADLDELAAKIQSLNHALHGDDGVGGKKSELAALETEFKETCWSQKQKYDVRFAGAFEGFRNNASNFKAKVLQEHLTNSTLLESLVHLEKRAEAVFGTSPIIESVIPIVEMTAVIAHESNQFLKKCVIGSEDVDIASMILKLGNSDWVKEGRTFYDVNDRLCPFCQQSTTDVFARSLREYFDETFERDSKAIISLDNSYKTDSERLQNHVTSIINSPFRFIDIEKLKAEKALLDSKITVNVQRLAVKKKEPSRSVELDSLTGIASAVKALIDDANSQIADHNKMIANLAQERHKLTAQVWKYLLEVELKTDLATYEKKRAGLNKAIVSITEQVANATKDNTAKIAEIRMLEQQTTSIQPTIDGINALLRSFGHCGFSLAKADSGSLYKLVRSDGSDAKESLSEGERSFVTFLYFYHLLKGSNSESGITTDRVVIFDDPVSSVDSDTVFIVGSLIKGLFEEVRSGTGHIKQVFVLTHNVYFHKEVTFNPKRGSGAMNDETFWIVRKIGHNSKVTKHDSNPIKTSYELLWAEVRNPVRSNLTIQNTLRRILEGYFRILGSVDPDKLYAMFEGKDKLICKSLFSWVNSGSHDTSDDLYISIDDSSTETYLNVFRAIFEKSRHDAHYKMMMGDAYIALALDATP